MNASYGHCMLSTFEVGRTPLPLGFLFEQAHAACGTIRRVSSTVLGKALRSAAKRINKENAENLADGLGEFTKALKRGDAAG